MATPRDEMKVGVMLVGPNKMNPRRQRQIHAAVRDLMPGPVKSPNTTESTIFPMPC